jgi:hypothetical protein
LANGTGVGETICVPLKGDSLFGDKVCNAFYSPAFHQLAIDLEVTQTYGAGAAGAAALTGSVEAGIAYGKDGCFGCYLTTCTGVAIDLGFALAACTGEVFGDLSAVAGDSCVLSLGIATPIAEIGGSASLVFGAPFSSCILGCIPPVPLDPLSGCPLIGGAQCFSVGLGINPLDTTVEECATITNTVACQDPTSGALVLTAPEPPVCLRGAKFVTCPGSAVDLPALAIDPDGDDLDYAWSTDCPGSSFDDDSLAAPTLTLDPAPSCAGLSCTVSVTASNDEGTVMCSAIVQADSELFEAQAVQALRESLAVLLAEGKIGQRVARKLNRRLWRIQTSIARDKDRALCRHLKRWIRYIERRLSGSLADGELESLTGLAADLRSTVGCSD